MATVQTWQRGPPPTRNHSCQKCHKGRRAWGLPAQRACSGLHGPRPGHAEPPRAVAEPCRAKRMLDPQKQNRRAAACTQAPSPARLGGQHSCGANGASVAPCARAGARVALLRARAPRGAAGPQAPADSEPCKALRAVRERPAAGGAGAPPPPRGAPPRRGCRRACCVAPTPAGCEARPAAAAAPRRRPCGHLIKKAPSARARPRGISHDPRRCGMTGCGDRERSAWAGAGRRPSSAARPGPAAVGRLWDWGASGTCADQRTALERARGQRLA